MSAAEAVLRVLEELRQTALTEALGQVTCSGDHAQVGLVGYVLRDGGHCFDCGAQV